MKRISIRVAITLLTFLIGTAVATFWTVRKQTSVRSIKQETDCVPGYIPSAHSSNENVWETVLDRFQEMPLESLPACVDESYRVIWVPTFHAPVAVRIWSSQGRRYLLTKQLDGRGGYGMGRLALDKQQPLSDEQWFSFKKLLMQASYWDLSSADDGPIPHDGAEWIIEGLESNNHHSVHRRSPGTEFRAACIYLVQLSGLKTEIEEY